MALYLFQPAMLSGAVYTSVRPFVYAWGWIKNHSNELVVYFESKDRLQTENQKLLERFATQGTELSLLRSLYPDLETLQKLLLQERSTREIVAGVLLAPPLSPYDVLVLESGITQGVAVGDIVRSSRGTVLGKITEVFRNFSRATLFSSPGTKMPVRIGKEGIQAEAMGMGGGEFQLLLPRELLITVGDSVTFPGIMPTPVGVVQSVEFRDVDFLQLISFRTPEAVSALHFVVIEASEPQDESR